MLKDLSILQFLLAIAGVAFLIAWHELGHYVAARLLGMRVLKYSIGFGPKILGFRHADIDYQVGALPLGGYVQILGMTHLEEGAKDDPRSFINRPRWARWLVLAAGPGFNYILAAGLFFAYGWFWPSPVDHNTIEVVQVSPGGAAEQAGLLPGDFITAIDGTAIGADDELRDRVIASQGAPLSVSVLRNGAPQTVTVTPRAEGNGFLIGVVPTMRNPREPFFQAVGSAVEATIKTSKQTLGALASLVRREDGVDVGSPVAIVADMKQKIALGMRYFIVMLAILSTNLGLLNLLPVPALDGIKMFFLTVEGAARRDLNQTAQIYVNAAGMLLLLGLMVVLMARDTFRLLS